MSEKSKSEESVAWNSGAEIGHMKQTEREALDGAAMDKLRTLLKCLPESPYKAQMRTEVEALRQRVKEQEVEIARLQRERAQQKFGSIEVYLREDCFIKAAEINRLNSLLTAQAEKIQHLQMALADAEALEQGTSERCEKQAEQIKVARDAIVTLRKFVGDPANFDCYGTEEEISDFLQRVKRDEDAAIKQADEALTKLESSK